MGKVFAGAGIGLVVGYPFGGAFASVQGGIKAGWKYPFIITGGISVFALIITVVLFQPRVERRSKDDERPTSMWVLMCDSYVLVVFVTFVLSGLSLSVVEPILPTWMENNFTNPKGTPARISLVMASLSIAYVVAPPIAGRMSKEYWWLGGIVGQMLIATGMALLPCAMYLSTHRLYFCLLPLLLMGVGMGIGDAVLVPLLGTIVDVRYTSVYGSIYAISTTAFCIGFAIGPIYAVSVAKYVSFRWATWSASVAVFAFSFLIIHLKNIKKRMSLFDEVKGTAKCTQRQDDEITPLL
eukprot:m.224035 g.224035  ORF g.224035 m.224035 type:complete len:296 (+) comp39988_c1_seq14:2632-3519(+)